MSENTSRTFHNSGSAELVYDMDGHMLGAGESVDVPTPVSDDRIKKLLKSGQLVEVKQTHKIPARKATQPESDAKNGDKK